MQLVLVGIQLVGTHQTTVPGDSRLQGFVVGRVQPDDPSAPAEPGDGQFRCLCLARFFGPCDGRVEVRHDLCIGNRLDDFEDLLEVAQFRHVSLAGIQFRGDSEVSQLGQPAADVFDVLVNAEDLLHHQHDRKGPARRGHRPISRHLAIFDRAIFRPASPASAPSCDRS